MDQDILASFYIGFFLVNIILEINIDIIIIISIIIVIVVSAVIIALYKVDDHLLHLTIQITDYY